LNKPFDPVGATMEHRGTYFKVISRLGIEIDIISVRIKSTIYS
jgi:hypothetical protein